jgi:SAM-dependent methyltransferase
VRRGPAYRRFWNDVGENFPDLEGAASTNLYRRNEERLLTDHAGRLRGARLLKTDLWDEAKNTRILQWAAAQGAAVYGIDISESIVRLARAEDPRIHAVVGDCRRLPYPDEWFDAVYSMGTIEHFDNSETAVGEMWRVLKPGGRAIVGVPNRMDPFLRPLLVAALSAVRLYGYGYEKSYSRPALRSMVESFGFVVVAETAILFIPGWIRMFDLACHAYVPALSWLGTALVKPFDWIDERLPIVRRHGYLIVAVAEKPL